MKRLLCTATVFVVLSTLPSPIIRAKGDEHDGYVNSAHYDLSKAHKDDSTDQFARSKKATTSKAKQLNKKHDGHHHLIEMHQTHHAPHKPSILKHFFRLFRRNRKGNVAVDSSAMQTTDREDKLVGSTDIASAVNTKEEPYYTSPTDMMPAAASPYAIVHAWKPDDEWKNAMENQELQQQSGMLESHPEIPGKGTRQKNFESHYYYKAGTGSRMPSRSQPGTADAHRGHTNTKEEATGQKARAPNDALPETPPLEQSASAQSNRPQQPAQLLRQQQSPQQPLPPPQQQPQQLPRQPGKGIPQANGSPPSTTAMADAKQEPSIWNKIARLFRVRRKTEEPDNLKTKHDHIYDTVFEQPTAGQPRRTSTSHSVEHDNPETNHDDIYDTIANDNHIYETVLPHRPTANNDHIYENVATTSAGQHGTTQSTTKTDYGKPEHTKETRITSQ